MEFLVDVQLEVDHGGMLKKIVLRLENIFLIEDLNEGISPRMTKGEDLRCVRSKTPAEERRDVDRNTDLVSRLNRIQPSRRRGCRNVHVRPNPRSS